MRKSEFLQDFKAFAMRGNVIDMAVGVIIGGAFGKIISSVVADVIMPPLGLLVGGVNFTDLKLELNYKIPCSGVISRPAASTSCRSFFITSAGIHLRSTLTVRTRLRLRTMSIGA